MSHTIGSVKQYNQQLNSNSSQPSQDPQKLDENTATSVSSLTDGDYEFLFNQLLEGVSHGWHHIRIVKFFNQLGDRGQQQDWVAWLERLSIKISTLPIDSKRQLGAIMIRLGELTQSTPEVQQIGMASNLIGRQLLFGNINDLIWEYNGPDLELDSQEIEVEDETLSERLPKNFYELASSSVEETTEANLASETALSEADQLELTTEDLTSASESPEDDFEEDSFEDFMAIAEISEQIDAQPDAHQDSQPLTSSTEEKSLDDLSLNILESESSSAAERDNSPTSGDNELKAINLQQIMALIQEDPELAQQISQKLNIPATQVVTNAEEEKQQLDAIPVNASEQSSLDLIESWFNLGLKQVSAGEFSNAISSWEKALKINPNLSEAWHNRGSALGRLGQYETAIESFESALTIDKYNYQAWNDRAHALYQLQKWPEAVASWNNAIKIMPGNHLFWYNRGCALEQFKSLAESIASYEKALEIKPDFQPARSRYINLIADNSPTN